MTPLTVGEQDAGIRREFPGFRLLFDYGFVGAWRGSLAPIARPYEITVLYFPFRFWFDDFSLSNRSVTVRIGAPAVSLDPRGTGEAPHHIYRDDDGSGFSLCLFDHRDDEWSRDHSIAETILPWAAEWLFYFEGWLYSGRWEGGGNHPTTRNLRCPMSSPSSLDQQVPFPSAACDRVGRLIGTSVSFQLMAAASEDYSLRQFWRDSSQRWEPTALSQTTST